MKKLLIITISVLFSVISYAQTIEDGSKWWDGKNLYRACVSDPNEAFFELVNEEGDYKFFLSKIPGLAGTYTLEPSNTAYEAPFRAQYGWLVKYTREEGMYFLSVGSPVGETVWVLTLTPDYLHHCQGQLADAIRQPVESMVTDYLMSPGYLSYFTKDELKNMLNLIDASGVNSVITRTNKASIKSELKVTDSERAHFSESMPPKEESEQQEPETPNENYHASVKDFYQKVDGLNYLLSKGYPMPMLYGDWEPGELTYVVMPKSPTYTLEIWETSLDENYNVVPSGDAPLFRGEPGNALCFSYITPEGMPSRIVVCREGFKIISAWVPQFSGMDGSLVTTPEFILSHP